MNLYDVLAGQGTTHFERLFSQSFAGGAVQTLTGQPPLSFKADGTPLTSVVIKGNGSQASTPTPSAPIPFDGCGDWDSDESSYAIPITCASVTTPLYLGEVSTTRRIKRLVFDGTENWRKYTQSTDTLYYLALGNRAGAINVLCSHCSYSQDVPQSTTPGVRVSNSMVSLLLNLGTAIGSNTETDFKAHLASEYSSGTPVEVWYVLATEQTGIVNEPLMKIGDYADTLTTDTPIPTAKGINTLSVDTTVQPSEMTITFKG